MSTCRRCTSWFAWTPSVCSETRFRRTECWSCSETPALPKRRSLPMADERDSSARLVEAAPEATGAARHEIVLGATKAAPALLDVGKLLATRLLIQAGSGGGQSWLLRRLLAQSHGMV